MFWISVGIFHLPLKVQDNVMTICLLYCYISKYSGEKYHKEPIYPIQRSLFVQNIMASVEPFKTYSSYLYIYMLILLMTMLMLMPHKNFRDQLDFPSQRLKVVISKYSLLCHPRFVWFQRWSLLNCELHYTKRPKNSSTMFFYIIRTVTSSPVNSQAARIWTGSCCGIYCSDTLQPWSAGMGPAGT